MIHGIENLLPPDEISDFDASLQRFSDRAIRMRTDRSPEGIPFHIDPIPWFNGGYWVSDPEVRPGGSLSYAAADFYIQDAASMFPLRLLDVQPQDRIVDCCASPGGKSSAIAERLGPDGYLVANEAIHSRIDVLHHNMARTGRANYATCRLDPEQLALRCSHLFNKMILDVPCSGQTLVGAGKHDASAFRPKHIEHCALRARRILQAAVRMLQPGGLLVFSTCTFAIEENEAQIQWLIDQSPEAWQPLEIPELRAWKSPLQPGCYRLWPHRDRCRGGFAAAMRLVAEIAPAPSEGAMVGGDLHHKPQRRGARTSKATHTALEPLLSELGTWPIGVRVGIESATVAEPGIDRLLRDHPEASEFRVPRVAIVAGRHAEPTHVLALAAPSWFIPHQSVELQDIDATTFMGGESLGPLLRSETELLDRSAWARAMWRNKPLGWLKRSTQRWNNHLPSWARIAINVSGCGREPS